MTKKTDAWMPLWIGAYLADTMRLTTVQHGAYLLLLMAYWRAGEALPDDDEELRAITRTDRAEWKKIRPVLAKFFKVGDGVWWHKRVEAEIEGAGDRAKKASDRAKKGAKTRWGDAAAPAEKGTASNQQASQKPCLEQSASNQQALLKRCPTPSPSPLYPNQSSVVEETTGPPQSGGDDGFAKPENRTRMPWPDGTAPGDAVTWASVFGDEFGVPISTAQPGQWGKFCPLASAWIGAGVTVGQMRQAVDLARVEAVEPIAYLPAYADRVLASMVPRQARPPLAVVPTVDPDGRAAIEAEGVAKGIGRWDELREHWPAYRDRVRGKAACFAPSLAAIVQQGLKA